MTCDLLVVGAGPGGFDAALAAARAGLSVTLAERGPLGGACLNWGCIPTKLYLGATAAIPELQAQQRLKLLQGDIRVDLAKLVARKERHVAATRKAMAKELDQAGVLLLPGTARIMRPGAAQVAGPEVEGDPREVAFHHLILATGSQPAAFPGLEPDGDAVLDSTDLLDLDQPLENLIVVGGGAIGLELAEFHRRLGAEVTVVEAMDRLLPAEDPEIASLLAGRLKRSGWNLRLGARVESLTTDHGRAHLRLADGEALAADKALVAVGRRPNSADLGLDALGAEPQGRGWIETDEHLRFAEGCYAVGDVNGRALLAHAASHQGEYAVRHILGAEPGPYSPGPIPSCVYGSVEVMRVGPTPAELAEESGPVAVSRVQFAANPIAQAHGAGHGLVKVAWAGERVASITAVGHHASHLVTQAGLIVEQGWTADDAGRRIFAHPTLDESLKAALLAPRQAIEGGS